MRLRFHFLSTGHTTATVVRIPLARVRRWRRAGVLARVRRQWPPAPTHSEPVFLGDVRAHALLIYQDPSGTVWRFHDDGRITRFRPLRSCAVCELS